LKLEATSSVDAIESVLADCLFDELVWVAPDVAPNTCYRTESSGLIIEQQEQGVLAIFRIIKALMQMGYANKELKWTIITRRTQLVTADDEILPGHAAVSGLIGCLAKECPRWNLRLLDLDSLSVAATECLTLPWDKQGNVLAYRRNGWFQQGLAPTSIRSQTAPVYRKHGVYVVIGGAGGLGEVWTRFMIEHYQAKVVWIGRRPYDGSIKEKINLLAGLRPAPLYISADATNLDALAEAGRAILKAHPAIHGVVQSAIVLRDQSLADMEESEFRTSLSAKVDVSVNMDRVFGKLELDFMLFFSSILSFFKTPRQANYAAGCTFKDSFARKLQLERAYPVKVMNWGYWGSVGVVAHESYRQTMRQLGVGSIDPQEGMELLQAFVNCDLTQMAVIKTLSRDITAGLLVAQPDTKSDSLLRQARQKEQVANQSIHHLIVENLSEALKIVAAKISTDVPVMDYGVDSIIGVNLVRTINEALEIDLPLKALFGKTTVAELVEVITTNRALAERAIDVERVGVDNPRKDLVRWSDFRPLYGFFFPSLFTPVTDPSDERLGGLDPSLVRKLAADFADSYRWDPDQPTWFAQIRELAARHGFAPNPKAYKQDPDAYPGMLRDAANVIRVALTGSTRSPDLHAVAGALGPDEVIRRVRALVG